MDPQLAEYRRKQRERAAEVKKSTAASAASMKQYLIVVGVILVAVAAAAVRTSSSVPPPAGPLGTCPKPTGMGLCVEECSTHDDCRAQGKLCCSNGCGHVCMEPEVPGQEKPDSKCTLMVTLASKDSAAAVLKAVPSPATHKHLMGVGIMILNYAAGHSSDCCAAERALRALPEAAKSIEYDGPKPACAVDTSAVDASAVDIDGGQRSPGQASAPEGRPVVGGWSEGTNEIDQESLDVWEKLLAKSPVHKDHDLKALGKPVSVRTQVVAGMNYEFAFGNGATVTVFHQPWTQTLEVSAIKL